jgi:hypothetical protein
MVIPYVHCTVRPCSVQWRDGAEVSQKFPNFWQKPIDAIGVQRKPVYATGTTPYSSPTVLNQCRRAVIRGHNVEIHSGSQFPSWLDGETTTAS